MGRTSWADGEILLASSAERRAASALVLVEPVGGVGPLTRRLPRCNATLTPGAAPTR
jgi:hypothetical protein